MTATPPVTIIITSYNYGRFLRQAIDSALGQTYRDTEVIVVDDGSTDNSRAIIAGYGDRVVAILKNNGGQASAFNRGFQASHGSIIVFLDSDDALSPTAIQQAIGLFRDGVAKVHWPLWEVDRHGRRTGKVVPSGALSAGDLLDHLARNGPDSYVTSPTTGNAWARPFLEIVLPIPEEAYRTCADGYLATLAPLFGSIERVLEPQGIHRVHDDNALDRTFYAEKIQMFDHRCHVLSRYLRDIGINVAPESWTEAYYGWLRRIEATERDLVRLLSPEDRFILVDQDQFRREFALGRLAFPFLERDGEYWGAPPDDYTAIGEVDRLRGTGARLLVFAWPAFWWLDHYSKFHAYLRSSFRCVLQHDRLIVFDLQCHPEVP